MQDIVSVVAEEHGKQENHLAIHLILKQKC